MSTKPIDIIVSGHLCLDLLPQMDHVTLSELPSPGRLFEVGALGVSTGGAVSNTGLALQRLGVDVRLMASVGDDLIGRAIVQFMNDRDPALTEHIRTREGQQSSYTVVLSPENVDRIFLHCTGTNRDFSSSDVDIDVVSGARVFHLGYPPILPRLYADGGRELVTIFERVKQRGVVTSLDTSLPDAASPAGKVDWREILTAVLPYVDVFVPSIDEIVFMLRRSDYDKWGRNCASKVDRAYLNELAQELLQMGAAVTGFKLGEYGMLLCGGDAARLRSLHTLGLRVEDWAGAIIWHPAFAVNVVGTTGAGDSAYAGVLQAVLSGWSPQISAQWASAVGACNVEAADATSGIRTAAATRQRIDAGWAVRPERVPGF